MSLSLIRIFILICLLSAPALARQRAYGFCQQGNQKVTTGGSVSTTIVMGNYPRCTVTVYLSGTLALASIFSDNVGTSLLNPFTADSFGFWYFYADDARYDIKLSGGGLAAPWTIGDYLLNQGGSIAGVSSFNGRSGAVTPQTGDYNFSQISGNITLHTHIGNTQGGQLSISAVLVSSLTGNGSKFVTGGATSTGKCVEWDANGNAVTAVSNLPCGAPGSGVTSFNGRTGSVVPAFGDYSFPQITGINPVSTGGTGASTLTGILEGHGTSPFTVHSASSPFTYLRSKLNAATLVYSFDPIPFTYAKDYDWSQQPGGSIGVGANTITLTPCPYGLTVATDQLHYVYLSNGAGTPESVLINGGSCSSGASTGTIGFVAAHTHTGAWTVQSATGGIHEAVNITGYNGGVWLGCASYEIYAEFLITYRTSVAGCGQDVTLLHNNSTTTGVINYTALTLPGDQSTFGGLTLSGFTIYAGALTNTAVDTVAADAIHIVGPGWGVTGRDIMIRNHAVGVHQINGWSSHFDNVNCRYIRDYCYLTETDLTMGVGTEAGAGQGGDQRIENSYISNVGATGTPTDTGCGIRYANWSGAYLHHVSTTAMQYGLCLQPRALKGAETYSQVYYGQVDDSVFDTSVHDGILLDTTNGTSGGVTEFDFIGVKSAYNGCLQSQANACSGVNFANAANGVNLKSVGTNVIRNIRFIGGAVRENGGHGVLTAANAYTNSIKFIGMDADNNSQAATNTYDGYHIGAGNFQITIQGASSGSINSVLPRHPRYGLFGDTALTQMNVTGNTFYPLNATAPCLLNSTSALNIFTGNYPLTDGICNQTFQFPGQVGANVASAATITPTVNAGGVFHITGTATINTMNSPVNFPIGGGVCAIADGLWNMTTAGNIAHTVTAVVGLQYCMAWDPNTNKWYPTSP